MDIHEGVLLRVFISEDDKHEGVPLYEWIVGKALEEGLAGATVLRGLLGYGAGQRIHGAKILRLTENLPLVVEIVDDREKVEGLLDYLRPALGDAMLTLETVRYGAFRRG